MSSKNPFDDMKRAKEEEYFRKKEKELIDALHRRVALEEERRSMADITGTADEEILTTLQEMGYTRETVRLLYLVPLVEVAWASGEVTNEERSVILDAAGLIGVAEGHRVHEQLVAWLDQRPTDQFFTQTLRVISHLIHLLPRENQDAGRKSLMQFCLNVAAASGGILGFGNKVSSDEQAVIERIATELEDHHQDAARQVIEAGA